jgi:hypothetical protein
MSVVSENAVEQVIKHVKAIMQGQLNLEDLELFGERDCDATFSP